MMQTITQTTPLIHIIYRYSITWQDRQTVLLPEGATILCAKERDGELFLWALVDPAASNTERYLCFYGTGGAIPPARESQYIETFLTIGGMSLSLFEVKP